MTLTAHAVGGAAVAVALHAHPLAGIAAAFGSHFILDAIPHWDHTIHSRVKKDGGYTIDRMSLHNHVLIGDIVDTEIDGLLGLLVTGVVIGMLHPEYFSLAIAGAIFGMTPDALQFLYFLAPHSPVKYLQRFHLAMHAKTRLNDRPWVGIPLQLLFILFFIAAMSAV